MPFDEFLDCHTYRVGSLLQILAIVTHGNGNVPWLGLRSIGRGEVGQLLGGILRRAWGIQHDQYRAGGSDAIDLAAQRS